MTLAPLARLRTALEITTQMSVDDLMEEAAREIGNLTTRNDGLKQAMIASQKERDQHAATLQAITAAIPQAMRAMDLASAVRELAQHHSRTTNKITLDEAALVLAGILGCEPEWPAIYDAAHDAQHGCSKFQGAMAMAAVLQGEK